MYDQLIERINRGIWQQIAAFFILWFAVYSSAWTIIEPLGFTFNEKTVKIWRVIYVASTLLLCFLIFFFVFFRKKLEKFGLEEGNTDLASTAKISGPTQIIVIDDGMHGKVYEVSSSSDKNFIDWSIKASAHKAKFITFVYKPIPNLFFYARVTTLSKNKQSSRPKWLRFETSRSIYQSITDDEEMGIPVTASDDDGFLRVTVNLTKTVTNAFGRHGWRLDKITGIRARGSGKIKSISLK